MRSGYSINGDLSVITVIICCILVVANDDFACANLAC